MSPPTTSSPSASAHDSNLIDLLFTSALDGEYVRDQIAGTYKAYDPAQDKDTAPAPVDNKADLDATLVAELKRRELEAIKTAEGGDIAGAITALSAIISDCPQYASAYNNRAQAYRLEGKEDLALQDLNSAIKHGTGEILGQAFTQKAVILRAHGDQDGAFYNFSQGAKHGNEVARMAAAKENPYAKLCGKIVQEQMRQLRNPTVA